MDNVLLLEKSDLYILFWTTLFSSILLNFKIIKNTILSPYFSNFELSMKKVFYTLFFLSLIHFASAQNLMWAKKMGA